MRKFSSYGQINTNQHYYAPRKNLINTAYTQLMGENLEEGGHYITVWAPRQRGKSSLMLEVTKRIRKQEQFDVVLMTIESAKYEKLADTVIRIFVRELQWKLERELPQVASWEQLAVIFTRTYLTKPLILIIDEFDALEEEFINKFASEFRRMYTDRATETTKSSGEKTCLLHGLALIGVRSVLGIENVTGSPFNVQRSLHIPNLTYEEVDGMFKWYARESGQPVEQNVIDQLYYETQGQPGLTCWLGELLTEGFEEYTVDKTQPITLQQFEQVYAAAINVLPNNNILNIISKTKPEPYKNAVLDLFQTEEKIPFKYDNPIINYLYLNGVVDRETIDHTESYVKFSCPFVQKRLFNYFADAFFHYTGKLHEPFEDLASIMTDTGLNIKNLAKRFQSYLKKNRDWLLKDAPKRKDLRIYEAVYHFCFYRYLCDFLGTKYASVHPEFPTGNGKIDLIITYRNTTYGVELKSFTNEMEYYEAVDQAAKYGQQLQLPEIFLICFIEYIDEENRKKYEVVYVNKTSGVKVVPLFVETGN